MRDSSFYLGEGEFTKQTDYLRDVASQIREKYVIEEISDFVKSIPIREERDWLWAKSFRQRTANEIAKSKISTGCTDDALVFITLLRIRDYPTAYVETVEKEFLKKPKKDCINGHIFADIYQNNLWVPYNPRCGKTVKNGRLYLFRSDEEEKPYIEVARGLDFSQLYADETSDAKIELRTIEQFFRFVEKNGKRFSDAIEKR
jgi:hypothetical protein